MKGDSWLLCLLSRQKFIGRKTTDHLNFNCKPPKKQNENGYVISLNQMILLECTRIPGTV